MAEVVGVVAACLQLTQTVFKVKNICSDIKRAPQDIASLLEENVRLNKLLEAIVRNQQKQFANLASDAELQDILDLCTTASQELLKCASSLKQQINRNKWHGSIKAVLKKDELFRYQKDLEIAKTNLIIAQQMQSSLVQHQMFLQTLDTSTLLKQVIAGNSLTTTAIQPKRDDIDGLLVQAKSRNSLSTPSDNTLHRPLRRRAPARKYQVITPTRWLGWALQLRAWQQFDGWTFAFRTWYQRPDDWPLFEHARVGDIDALRQTLSSKEGSVSDRDAFGHTALHYAINNGQLKTARLLIEMGADVDAANTKGVAMLQEFHRYIGSRDGDSVALTELTRQGGYHALFDLFSQAGCDYLAENIEQVLSLRNLMDSSWSRRDLEVDLAIRSYLLSPLTSLWKDTRRTAGDSLVLVNLEIQFHALGIRREDMNTHIYSLGLSKSAFELIWQTIWQMWWTVAILTFVSPPLGPSSGTELFRHHLRRYGWNSWRTWICNLFAAESADNFPPYSIFEKIFVSSRPIARPLDGYRSCLLENISRLLISELVEVGIDFYQFAVHERHYLLHDGMEFEYGGLEDVSLLTVNEMRCGPSAESWTFGYQESFWSYFRSPENALIDTMPGAWNTRRTQEEQQYDDISIHKNDVEGRKIPVTIVGEYWRLRYRNKYDIEDTAHSTEQESNSAVPETWTFDDANCPYCQESEDEAETDEDHNDDED